MSDRYIEKTFIYLMLISLLLHGGAFVLFYLWPEGKPGLRQEPLMIDLQEQPQASSPSGKEQGKARRLAEKRHRVNKEMAPKGELEGEKLAPPPILARPVSPITQQPVQKDGGVITQQPQATASGPRVKQRPGESILKPKGADVQELSNLFPSAEKLARMEESYRKKYGPEVSEGEIKQLDADDFMLGSFFSRLEVMVYGVWRYPTEAQNLGIQGYLYVMATFNRKGEIESVELLKSSGSKILDEEALQSLRKIGPVGPLPKGYSYDKLHVPMMFSYTLIGKSPNWMIR